MDRRVGRALAFGFSGAIAIGASVPAWADGTIERVSLGPGGIEGNGRSNTPAVSARGRFVAFESDASNLVAGDNNGATDVFVRDRQAGTTRRVSVSTGGVEGNALSFEAAISASGRFAAFTSEASNLVSDGTTGVEDPDVFAHDLETGATERVSVSSGGVDGNAGSFDPALSATGRFVAFTSSATNLVPGDNNGLADVFVRDRQTGGTRRVSLGPGDAQILGGENTGEPAISADGRVVAFASDATDLVRRDTNGAFDVFVRDLERGTTRRVSVGQNGAQGDGPSQGPAVSADGRVVAFFSDATNLVPGDNNGLVDVFVRDHLEGTTRRASDVRGDAEADDQSRDPAVSADGRVVAFGSAATNLVPGDTNGAFDVFVRRLADD
jgi:Tol biopolymer transport system component